MANVRVFTDSTADIPKELAEKNNISVVPLKVFINGQSYLDGVTLDSTRFYQLLSESTDLPVTSQPSPMDFADAFKKAIREGATEIISLQLSSALSGTYQSAMLAKSMLEDQYPNVTISVIDSKTATYCLGMMVVTVARAAAAGKSLAELEQIAQEVRDTQLLVAIVDTLEYLQKGGRIGKASAFLGSILNIKPIISVNVEGEVFGTDKSRGTNKAITRIFELMEEKAPLGSAVSIAIVHSQRVEQAEEWLEKLKTLYDVREGVVVELGPVVGTHAGPGALGCVIMPLSELTSF